MYSERFQEFSGLISRAEKALQRAKAENVRSYGLRGVHVSCLLALCEREEGLTATELAAVCGVDRAQISRVAAELTARSRSRRRDARLPPAWWISSTKSSRASAGISRRRSLRPFTGCCAR